MCEDRALGCRSLSSGIIDVKHGRCKELHVARKVAWLQAAARAAVNVDARRADWHATAWRCILPNRRHSEQRRLDDARTWSRA